MTRLYGVIFVCAAAVLGTAMVGAGCSSSSSPAVAATDGGSEASVTVTPDGASPDGAPATVTLQWAVVAAPSADGGTSEAGAVDAGDAGAIADSGADGGDDGGDGGAAAPDASEERRTRRPWPTPPIRTA